MKLIELRPTMWTAFLSALLLTTAASAQTVTITMDELPFQPVNGLTVKGVTFHDTTGADFNAPNGGQLTYTQDPVTEGQTGGEVITLDFAYPVDNLRFAMALSGQGTFVNAFSVALFDPALNLIQTIPVDISQPPGDAFSNGVFTSHVLLSRAVITFNAGAPSAFGLDNVAFSANYFQARYAANLNVGDSVVDITNSGTSGGNICVNVYTFDPAEELISCCSCSVTPNGLQSLSVRNSLISNTLTAAIPTSVVIKLLATTGGGAACNASSPTLPGVASGMLAWGTTLHSTPTSPATFGVTETPFTTSTLSPTELTHITSFCGFIQANASGFGICKGCAIGGLGASTSN
jgi:hypothetical protein